MNLFKRALIVALALLSGWGCYELIDGWRVAHTSVEWVQQESESFTVMCPSKWTVTPSESKKGDWTSTVGPKPRHAFDLTIEDATRFGKSPTEIMNSEKERDEGSGRKIVLANGVECMTWTHVLPHAHFGIPVRNYAFAAPDGRIYHASHWIPPNWKAAWFYDRVYRKLLGSMKFKDPAPAKK
jgi:hypothetical protein